MAPHALYIIVSNPVDIMTYVFTKISGLPENQIIGSGTILDSARLRCGLSEHLNVAQNNIHAYVFGEHGDTSFIPWTGAYVSGVSWMNITILQRAWEKSKRSGQKMRCSNTYRNLADRSSREKELLSTQYLLPYANSALSCQLLLIPSQLYLP